MERRDVVILEVHLDKGLPVVVALVGDYLVELISRKVEGLCQGHAGKVVGNIALPFK